MKATASKTLLTVDSLVNLLLGILLLAFPAGLIEVLGIPPAAHAFYPNILGAILFGIGIALWLDRSGRTSGLGLTGAVSINLCGGIVLGLWLLLGNMDIPMRGQVGLWLLTVFLVGISGAELVAHHRRSSRGDAVRRKNQQNR